MNLRLQTKLTLKIILISLFVTTCSGALPTQCPSGFSFTHKTNQPWQWKQTYSNWVADFSNAYDNSSLQTVPGSSNLDVTISPAFKMITCDYYDNADSLDIVIKSPIPVYSIPDELPSTFKKDQRDSDGIIDFYECHTNTSTPEACNWNN